MGGFYGQKTKCINPGDTFHECAQGRITGVPGTGHPHPFDVFQLRKGRTASFFRPHPTRSTLKPQLPHCSDYPCQLPLAHGCRRILTAYPHKKRPVGSVIHTEFAFSYMYQLYEFFTFYFLFHSISPTVRNPGHLLPRPPQKNALQTIEA